MNKLVSLWRDFFDVREGELMRTVFMTLYLLFILFAYYILKAGSRALFLNSFDIDKLPYLYILIAGVGGILAYLYTGIAIRSSLKAAVTWATIFCIGFMLLIWELLSWQLWWVIYVFNVFVSLFSIMMVSQGWIVAANVFTSREAKRLYGILGVGSVLGAAFGGSFTAYTVHYIGTRNLLLASSFMVGLAYAAFLGVVVQKGVSLKGKKAAEEEDSFSFRDIVHAVHQHKHLQVIISIIMLTYIVDVMVEFQFSAMAKEAYKGDQLTAFLGSFYGIWLNLITFVLQFFLTSFVVSRFGVGGALQIMPVTIAAASVWSFTSPSVLSTGATRLTEAATRYSFNRTGMELLYLPLPSDLKNRTKAFVDVFVDRMSRGIGGILLVVLTGDLLNLPVRYIAVVVMGFSAVWILLSIRAKNEYITTVRKRLELRRLDLDALRVNVREPGTVKLLEETIQSGVPRQAAYALSLLAEAPGYNVDPWLAKLANHPAPELRAKVYEIACARSFRELYDTALGELRAARPGDDSPVIEAAVQYALWASPDRHEMAKRLVEHGNQVVARAALEDLAKYPTAADSVITREWLAASAVAASPTRRMLAAIGVRVLGDQDSGVLHKLLMDSDPTVAEAAIGTAGRLQDRAYLDALIRRLASARLRASAVDALATYGEKIVGTLGDVMLDPATPTVVRKQVPRVLQSIGSQRSVDVLLGALSESDLTVRSAALKALNRMREMKPELNYGRDSVAQYVLKEAKYYYEMNAALMPIRESNGSPAGKLLAATLEERLRSALERMFHLLGLRYPPKEIYAAFLAVNRKRKSDTYTAALDFLDNVLERELKRVLLPLLDDEVRIAQSGRELFGVEAKDVEAAVRELMRSGDSWLVSCAIATAADLKLNELKPEIAPLAKRAGTEVGLVAESAMAALSA